MTTYNINFNKETAILTVGFGDPASNDQIVKDAIAAADAIKSEVSGCSCLKVNGPASLPVAFALSHVFVHVVGAVACYDPKLSKYVVAVSHNPNFKVGDLVD